MTPGQEALAEAARLEAARVYTRCVRENRPDPVEKPVPAVDERAKIVDMTRRRNRGAA